MAERGTAKQLDHPQCPNGCGYSGRIDSVKRHLLSCHPSLPEARPATKRARQDEEPLLSDYEITEADLVKYKSEIGGAPWKANTIREILSLYGNKSAPKLVTHSVAALAEYLQELAERRLDDRTLSNYSNIIKNAILVRIWKFELQGPAVDAVKAKLGVVTKTAAHQATRSAMVEGGLVLQDPLEPARCFQHLRRQWASRFIAVRDSLTELAFNPAGHVNQQTLQTAESFTIAGLLLFQPSQRIEVFQSLVFLPDATHDDIRQQMRRSDVHQGRALVRNRVDKGDILYPTSFIILVLDDKSKEVSQTMILVPAVSLLLSLWLICRFDRRLWGHDTSSFVFGHNVHRGIDRLISKTVLQFLVADLEYPPKVKLHKIRSMCIASVCIATNGDLGELTNLATAMRHTLATANRYYNHWLKWTQARASYVTFHRLFSQGPWNAAEHFKYVDIVHPPTVDMDYLTTMHATLSESEISPAKQSNITMLPEVGLPADQAHEEPEEDSEEDAWDEDDRVGFFWNSVADEYEEY